MSDILSAATWYSSFHLHQTSLVVHLGIFLQFWFAIIFSARKYSIDFHTRYVYLTSVFQVEGLSHVVL